MALSHKPLCRQWQINYNHGFSKSPWQDILIVVETACAEMIGRQSAPFLHTSLLVDLLKLKTSTAALAEPCRVCWGPECDFAGCNVICAKGLSDVRWEGRRGDDFAWFGVHSANQHSGCYVKERSWVWADRNEILGKIKRDNFINDIYWDTYLQ